MSTFHMPSVSKKCYGNKLYHLHYAALQKDKTAQDSTIEAQIGSCLHSRDQN